MHDKLGQVIVVLLLGDQNCALAICEKAIKEHPSAGHIPFPEVMASRSGHPPSDEFSVFIDELRRQFEDDKQVIQVTGFPRLQSDAELLMKTCPHVLIFSIEPDPRKRTKLPTGDIRRYFQSLPQHHILDGSRNLASQCRFIESKVVGIIDREKIDILELAEPSAAESTESVMAK